MPTVSIVMPAYNAEKYIAQALDSVLAQSYPHWECIVVNDGSTDGTLAILERYAAQDSRIRFYTIPNSGSAKVPRDTAIEHAQYEWIIMLDADDYLAPDYLQKLDERYQQTGADIIYCRMVAFDNTSGKVVTSLPVDGFDFSQVVAGKEAVMWTIGGWKIGANGAMLRRSLLRQRSSCVSGIHHMNADEYDTRELLIMADRVAFVDAHYYYRKHETSITTRVSAKLFEPILTNILLIALFERTFGVGSSQARVMEREHLRLLVSFHLFFARCRHRLNQSECAYVKELLHKGDTVLSKRQIMRSGLDLPRRVLLLFPTSVIDWICRMAVKMHYGES